MPRGVWSGRRATGFIKMREETQIWIKKAKEDLDTAKYNLDGGKVEAGIFFLQQSVEKILKAIYMESNNILLRTHDLVLLAKKVNAPKKILDLCKELGPAYLYTRYPDVPSEEDLNLKADKFVSYTKEVLKWAEKNT